MSCKAVLNYLIIIVLSQPYLCKPFEFGCDIVVSSLTKWVGGHGAGLGGIIVDKGGFPWGAGKHPIYDEPDTSYSGMRWGHDLPDSLAPLSFILRARTVPLRNLGACMSRECSINPLFQKRCMPIAHLSYIFSCLCK